MKKITGPRDEVAQSLTKLALLIVEGVRQGEIPKEEGQATVEFYRNEIDKVNDHEAGATVTAIIE